MPALTLYVATSNAGKLRDFAAAAQALGHEYLPSATRAAVQDIAIIPFPCLERIPPPPENEPTFAGNAAAKAAYYSRLAPSLLVVADDSGLEVDALGGAPGVRSARYAADAGIVSVDTDIANNELLNSNLVSIPDKDRTARYRCSLALALDGRCLLTAEGTVEGLIGAAPRGSGGFGYDPLFYVPELGKTMAEIDLETKNTLSHRGRALRALLARLPELSELAALEPATGGTGKLPPP